jgi:hypothetical protein
MTKKIAKVFVDEEFGKVVVQKISVIETTIFGSFWDVSYMDCPDKHEYGVTLREHLAQSSITIWFSGIMERKKFMGTIRTYDDINQVGAGMIFPNLQGEPGILPIGLGKLDTFLCKITRKMKKKRKIK